MRLKQKYTLFILPILISSCHNFNRYKAHLKVQKNEVSYDYNNSNHSFNPYYEGFTLEPKYIDSTGKPYSGVVVKMLCKRKDSAIIENAREIDSMCIYKGYRYGYSKKYSSIEDKSAAEITFTNFLAINETSSRYPFCKFQINTAYNLNLNPKVITHTDITVLKQNMKFICSIRYLNKKIKIETTIERVGDELGLKQSTKMKHKTKLKDKKEIKGYLKLYPEIISQEMFEICSNLGVFNNIIFEDPVIKGNCKYN